VGAIIENIKNIESVTLRIIIKTILLNLISTKYIKVKIDDIEIIFKQTNPEKRDRSETERVSVARNLESSAMQGCLAAPKETSQDYSRRPRSKMREFVDSSGVACLQ
jgi:hypothetical protein